MAILHPLFWRSTRNPNQDIHSLRSRKNIWLFQKEIRACSGGLSPAISLLDHKPYLLSLAGDYYYGSIDLNIKQEIAHQKDKDPTLISSANVTLLGDLGKHISLSDTLHARILYNSAEYNPYGNEVGNILWDNKSRTLNSMEAYVTVNFPWLSILAGVDNLWWGPGWHGTLLLSDNSAPKDMIKLSGTYGPLQFTYFTSNCGYDDEKRYLAGHRLEITPHPKISIGINELVLFADQYKACYLNPLFLYTIMAPQDMNDNGFISFDLDLIVPFNIEIYGELLIDDFLPEKGLDAFKHGNTRFGILGGFYWADPFKLSDTDLRVEYAFTNQYTYTHRYEKTRYEHKGFVIGHWMGTDADDFWINAKHWFTDKLSASMTYELERHGEGDVTKPHPPPETGQWEFLSGVTESTHSISVGASYNLIGRYSVALEYTRSWIENASNQAGVNSSNDRVLLSGQYRF